VTLFFFLPFRCLCCRVLPLLVCSSCKVPYLTAELLARGYTEEECGKILGLNVLRVLARCEEVAEELQAQGALASDAKLEDLEPKHKKPKN